VKIAIHAPEIDPLVKLKKGDPIPVGLSIGYQSSGSHYELFSDVPGVSVGTHSF
jgi:hypothetical protein